jgi:hypothetical protein
MKKHKGFKELFFSIIVFAMILISCDRKPNYKLKIEGKKCAISLGEINFDNGFVVISVLADGNPMPNPITNKNTKISIGEQEVFSNSSNEQPVTMGLIVNGRMIFPYEILDSSEDGKFTFYVDDIPEKITVFTGLTIGETVYFDAKTKEIIGPEEWDSAIKVAP